ncbi:MAG: inositol monophosphatase [Patescibacteria group bacterium]|nr:inositol monophosphatase [Patescibacteria group bacterium]
MHEELEFAKKLALESGKVMLKYFNKEVKSRYKSDLSIVTIADEEINRNVISSISAQFPDHSVLGEEESSDKKSDKVWLCDPIDGTWPYAKGIPVASFSLALVKQGVSQLGVVYDPFMKRLYSAVKGKGAFLNSKKILVSNLDTKHATVNMEWWPKAKYDIAATMHKFSIDTSAYVLHLGSVITASCLVASGQYEACVYAGTKGKSIDIAAIKVIVEEAGGKVTDLFGNEQRYIQDIKGAVVSNGVIHEKILEYTNGLGATKKICISSLASEFNSATRKVSS